MTGLSNFRPSPSMAVAFTALVVALSGSAVAAVTLAKNSVKSPQIAPGAVQASDLAANAVISSKVKDGTLVAADFAAGQLPAGIAGPAGPAGTRGPTGLPGAPGFTGATGPSNAFQARQVGTVTLTGVGQNVVTMSLPLTGTYFITAGAQVTSQNNPATATCDSTKRGGALMSLSVGATLIDSATTALSPGYLFLANCLANGRWMQSTVVTTSTPNALVTVAAQDPIGSALTSNLVGAAAITAVRVASGTGATIIP